MNYREEILKATSEAATFLATYPPGNRTSFDIVNATIMHGIPFMYRPLKGLWGAMLTVGDVRGIMITSKLPRQVQRFTLAHELGHYLLGHSFSFDEQVAFVGRHQEAGRPPHEVAADTFASELLAPKSLILKSAKKHRWNKARLHDPKVIYQLSLRLGISYKATCWSLVTNNIILYSDAQSLEGRELKQIKHKLLRHPELLKDSWGDVWLLSRADSGLWLEAGPTDVFMLRIQDHASAGYIWNLTEESQAVVETLAEIQNTQDEDSFGTRSDRIIVFRFKESGNQRLSFVHQRPWSKEAIEYIDMTIDNHGKELEGFARMEKSGSLAAA